MDFENEFDEMAYKAQTMKEAIIFYIKQLIAEKYNVKSGQDFELTKEDFILFNKLILFIKNY